MENSIVGEPSYEFTRIWTGTNDDLVTLETVVQLLGVRTNESTDAGVRGTMLDLTTTGKCSWTWSFF